MDGFVAVTTIAVPVMRLMLLSDLRRLLLVGMRILLVDVLGVKSCTMTHRAMLILSSCLRIISISCVHLRNDMANVR